MNGRTLYSIQAALPFTDALASGLIERAGGEPLELARHLILLPTRRACRSLREAFLRRSGGGAMILPRMRPIGDVDEDDLLLDLGGAGDPSDAGDGLALPPAISDLRRRLLLARELLREDPELSPEHAARLAQELARFLDRMQTERIPFERLEGLAPEDYAIHWQEVLDFLSVLATAWPALLAGEGALDPAERRNRLLGALAEGWRDSPPDYPIIAAGTTGSIPATADLLDVVSTLPAGAVVLPGLDRELSDEAWQLVREEPSHPQHGLALLLDRLETARAEVADWDCPLAPVPAGATRARLLSAALAPAAATGSWRDLEKGELEAGLNDLLRIDASNPREEAGAIALFMREALETPGRTAALITPDRGLARRVAAALRRWDIEVDDSAGTPLATTAPGAFLGLTAALVAERCAPVAFLAALKHPLATGGIDPGAFRASVRAFEVGVLRGPRPEPGCAGLNAALAAAIDDPRAKDRDALAALPDWLARLETALAPLTDAMAGGTAPLPELVKAHVAACERLAASDGASGATRLWAGDAGEAAANFVSELLHAAADFPAVSPRDYPSLLGALISGRVVRPRYGRHPRLFIWGLMEARLQRADMTILGGLNETTWPPEAESDPWMSRPMQSKLGLPLPERRIGLTAHDFVQVACGGTVLMTRAARVEGQPTVASRWLLRIEAVLHALARTDPAAEEVEWPWNSHDSLHWHRLLHRREAQPRIEPPAPCPPVAARPRRLSVTQIETLMRDPYALYADKILGLRALDPLDADPGAADRGIAIHKALDTFVKAHPDALPADAHRKLEAFGREAFGPALDRPGVAAFWWPRFLRIADWFLEREAERRPGLAASHAEIRGELTVVAPAGDFLLTATADRVDRRTDDRLEIIDYKTGTLPSKNEIEAGYAPQLPLEAAIAEAGGFPGAAAAEVAYLAFWRLSGGKDPGEEKPLRNPTELARAAHAGLEALIAAFDDPATAYEARPRPDMAPRYTDYAHLERIAEWASGEEEA